MKIIRFTTGVLLALLLLYPTGAYAQFGSIFSSILGTITGPIGTALTDINQVRTQILQTEQQVLWPLSLITQAQNFVSTIKASYRGWMNRMHSGNPILLLAFGLC